MTGHAHRATGLCQILILIGSVIPMPAYAKGGNRDQAKPIRLYATAAFGPIGTLAWNSPDTKVAINGRLAYGERAIWDGDLIETTADTSVRVLLDSVGQVTLKNGARVRLATSLTRRDDDVTRRVLIASLTSGDMVVKLQQEATAYVEACGSAYISSSGASFRIGIQEGQVLAAVASGVIRLESEPSQINCAIRSVIIDRNRRVTGPGPNRISTNRRTTQDINLQLACNGQPVRGHPMLITLKRNIGKIGSQILTKPTDDIEGVVTVTFTAGGSANSSDITAAAVGLKPAPWIGHITIPGFWTPRNKLLGSLPPIISVSVWCIMACGDGNNGPVKLGPTTSKP
jgi:hypothetical protein